VLLLDEPAAGVTEAERHAILAAVEPLPVLLIEHDMSMCSHLPTEFPCSLMASCLLKEPRRMSRATPG